MDCLKFPQECPAEQRCLASTAIGKRGEIRSVCVYVLEREGGDRQMDEKGDGEGRNVSFSSFSEFSENLGHDGRKVADKAPLYRTACRDRL